MTPIFTISVGSSDLTGLIQERLISLEITDNTMERADSLTIELADCDRKIELPDRGAVISVGLGYRGNIRDMGQFVLEGVSISGPPDRVTLGATAAPFVAAGAFKPFQTRRSRSFDNISLGNLVRTIAGNSGLAAAVSSEFDGVVIPHLDQTNESDMNLLTRLARDYGAVMKPTHGRLVFVRRGQATSVTGKPLTPIAIDRSECSSYSAEWSKRAKYGTVKTRAHDVETGETGEYVESIDDDDGEGAEYEHSTIYPDAESAQRGAASILEQNSRLSENINLTLAGRPEIIAEGSITLTGFKSKMNGEWIIKSVLHSLSTSGFTTTVQGETSASAAETRKKTAKKGKKENRAFKE